MWKCSECGLHHRQNKVICAGMIKAISHNAAWPWEKIGIGTQHNQYPSLGPNVHLFLSILFFKILLTFIGASTLQCLSTLEAWDCIHKSKTRTLSLTMSTVGCRWLKWMVNVIRYCEACNTFSPKSFCDCIMMCHFFLAIVEHFYSKHFIQYSLAIAKDCNIW